MVTIVTSRLNVNQYNIITTGIILIFLLCSCAAWNYYKTEQVSDKKTNYNYDNTQTARLIREIGYIQELELRQN